MPTRTTRHATTARILVLRAVRDTWHTYPLGPTLAAVVVRAWEIDKQRFGLGGWNHPDSNRVITELVRLKKTGFLYQPAPSRYSLTDKGRHLLTDEDRRAARASRALDPNVTEAELDAIIEAERPTMPAKRYSEE